jgi:nucleotide-binding universal stress UspA family protein
MTTTDESVKASDARNRILVPLDPSDHSTAALQRACEMATRLNGEITGLTVLDSEGIMDSVALPFATDLLDFPRPNAVSKFQDATEKLDQVGKRFNEKCAESKVTGRLRKLKGSPAHGILDLIRFYDLCIMGLQSHFHFETETTPGDTLAQVLSQTAVPVVLTTAYDTNPLRRALIAYDGSPASTRALHAFARFQRGYAPEVRIITQNHDEKTGGHLLDEAQKFLQFHGIADITTELVHGPLIESLEQGNLEWADWIVAGTRSKTVIKRLMVGSFAEFLLERSHRVLLLAP